MTLLFLSFDAGSSSASAAGGGLVQYRDEKYGFSLLYPADMTYSEWQPTLDMLASMSFYDGSVPYEAGEPEIAVSVFSKTSDASLEDWLSQHSSPDTNRLQTPMRDSAARFDGAGKTTALTLDGSRAVLIPQASPTYGRGRLIVDNGDTLISLSYIDSGDASIKDAFATMAASLRLSDRASAAVDESQRNTVREIIDAYPDPEALPGERTFMQTVSTASTGYRLPWVRDVSHTVTQDWGGPGSHDNTQMWYAYDFDLVEGEEVRASRAGTVAWVQGSYSACGGSDYANLGNYVTVNHSDGTATLYLHLLSVDVAPGEAVDQSTRLGLSGKTGWTGCFPHLHFQRQAQGIWITNSQAIYFDEYPGVALLQGSSYISQNGGPTQKNFKSNGTYDGWMLESTPTSEVGGKMNSSGTTFKLGDNPAGREFRAVLSFTTSLIPDNAVITAATLKIKKASLVGRDPFESLGNITVDGRKGGFNNKLALQVADFQAVPSETNVATILNNPTDDWYSADLNSFASINFTGSTQLRLQFSLGDNGNGIADQLRFWSGNAACADRPILSITYYVP